MCMSHEICVIENTTKLERIWSKQNLKLKPHHVPLELLPFSAKQCDVKSFDWIDLWNSNIQNQMGEFKIKQPLHIITNA
jgi:P2-related tail formation protein